MSNKAAASSQVISLPKGGGALHGIGETFSPDLHTGTGNFSVPIALPPGRNGFQPQLSLGYSTGSGNGPFGLGWSLSIPGVSRKTSKGVPRYDDSQDTFILSGAEDLVPVDGGPPGARRYRPRTEGLFAHIDHYRDPNNDYWQVRSKDGLVSLYGTPGAAGRDPAVVADPAHRAEIFAWKLSRTVDVFGNRIDYRYERDAVQVEDTHWWDQLYLAEIRYVDYGEHTAPAFLVSVQFTYADRPDHFSEYRPGFEIRTVRRCSRIDVSTHADGDAMVRTYHLEYLDEQSIPPALLPLNRASLLVRVRVEGHDGVLSEALPPLQFGYTRFEPEGRTFIPITGPDMPSSSLARPDYALIDLFGHGLPDVLEMNGTVRYWRNVGGGRFALPREMRDAPAGLALASPGVQMLDANGDGRLDLMITTDSLAGYFPLRFEGVWDRRSFQRYALAPSFNLQDPEVHLVDLDGDGVTDAIRSGTRLECFFNDPYEGWNATRWVERKRDLAEFPDVHFSDPRVKWADMTADGLQDIVLVYDGNIEYWPNQGYGAWGKRIHMKNSPRLPYGYDPRRILIGDVDGDGAADIVYVDDTRVTLWINQSGNSWSEPIVVTGTPPVSDLDAVRLADMLGTGVSGVLWSADARDLSRARMFFLDFTGGVKPYLLNEMHNHIGALTHVAYAPSTHFYLADQQRPETRWQTPLPFPVQVVARVEAIDEIAHSKLTTEYSYHHGYWDGAEREFRGFGRVDQRDTEVFQDFHADGLHPDRLFEPIKASAFSPPTETRTWFHQGPIGDEFGEWDETDFSNEFWSGDSHVLARPVSILDFLKGLPRRVKRDALRTLRGSVLRTELYALDGTERADRPYTVTESLHGVREEAPPDASDEERQHIFFPHALAQRTTQWQRGDDPMTQFTFTGDYDDYGQPRSQIAIAVPRGRDFRVAAAPGAPYLATHTVTAYTQPRDDTRHYIVNRVARTTTQEILNDGSPGVFTLRDAIRSTSVVRRLIGQTRSFYDGPAFAGLPFGQIGDYGALVCTESLVLTEEILREAYQSSSVTRNPAEQPPYVTTGGTPLWTAEYPPEFRGVLPPLAGYTFHAGGPDPIDARGYFVATERRAYDFHDPNAGGKARGLVTTQRDALGHDTTIVYDRFDLLPAEVTDAAGLTTTARYDYRVLQPREVIDPNGNQSTFSFSALGLLQSTSIKGKAGEGDQRRPSVRMEYDFLAFANAAQPIFVRAIRHIHHDTEADISELARDDTIESIEYSDGFGRLLQTRTQAEDVIFGDPVFGGAVLPAAQNNQAATRQNIVGQRNTDRQNPNVVVSGWQAYDNKGRVVEKYEPFFSTGWGYALPSDTERGQKIEMDYDPRGHVVRTINPDASEQRVVYGVPGRIAAPDVSTPDRFEPTPWEAYTYDANDNAGRTHPATSLSFQHHWDTPASIVVDALGRTVAAVERNRSRQPDGTWSPIEEYRTCSTYDIQGNVLTVTDALGRVAFRHVYDLAKHPLRVESIDAGVRRSILDAVGNVVEQRDSKGALILHAYDMLNRPVRLWARDGTGQALTLRERLEYGDGGDPKQPIAERNANRRSNRLGKPARQYDEAGLLAFETYDFKGNLLEKVRRVIGDATILAVFNAPRPNDQVQAFRVDWQPPGGRTLEQHTGSLLDAQEYRTSVGYDALNRVKTMRYPQDVEGARKELRPQYNRAGALERVTLESASYVEHIAYNAKGQRAFIACGNGVIARHAYDPLTFRLLRLRTERYTQPNDTTYHPIGAALQELAYGYDLAGNITAIDDRTPGSGIPNTPLGADALDRAFTYDPLYRLIAANGRECATTPPDPPWDDRPKSQDVNLTRAYVETYAYDQVGNITRLGHSTGATRTFKLMSTTNNPIPDSNRLATVTIGQTDFAYTYDDNGNLIQETTARHFEWDHGDRMRVYRTQPGDAEPSVHAHYLYDAGGQRVKKLVRKQGGQVEVTVYIDGIFEHQRIVQGGAVQGNNTLHVMDNQSRIALVRVGRPFNDDNTPAVKYQLGDHLGSSNVVVNEAGNSVNREEYTPYGETSFGSFARKRYRFTGKERDEESGQNYHGARYYAPWLIRWASCDPAGIVDGVNLYVYVRSKPVISSDSTGTQTDQNLTCSPKSNTSSSTEYENKRSSESDRAIDNLNADNAVVSLAQREGKASVQKIDAKQWENDVIKTLERTNTPQNKTVKALAAAENQRLVEYESEQRQEAERQAKIEKELPGALGSATPVYGESKNSYARFSHGDYVGGSVHGVLAISDVFLAKAVVIGGVKVLLKGAGVLLASETASLAAKSGANFVGKTRIVYVLKDAPDSIRYVGRASGIGTAEDVLYQRLTKGHRIFEANPELYAEVISEQSSKEANLGAESVYYDYFRETGHKLLNSTKSPPLSDNIAKIDITRNRIQAFFNDW